MNRTPTLRRASLTVLTNANRTGIITVIDAEEKGTSPWSCSDKVHRHGSASRYIRCGSESAVRTRSERIGDEIVIDFTTNEAVLGIVLLGYAAEVLDVARAFAAEHALVFRRELVAALGAA